MTLACEVCRSRLLEGERAPAVDTHPRGGGGCPAVDPGLAQGERHVASLPILDAPDALVERTLVRVESEAAPDTLREGVSSDVTPDAQRSVEEPVVVGSSSLFAAALAAVGSALGALFLSPWILVRALGRLASALRGWWSARPPREPAPSVAPPRRGFRWLDATIVTSIAAMVGLATYSRFGIMMIKGKIDGSTSTLDAMPCDGACGGDGAGGEVSASTSVRDDLPSFEPPSFAREEEQGSWRAAPSSVVDPSPSGARAVEPSVSRPVAAAAASPTMPGWNGLDDWQHARPGAFEVELRQANQPVAPEPEEIAAPEVVDNRRGERDDDGRDVTPDHGIVGRDELRSELAVPADPTDREQLADFAQQTEHGITTWSGAHRVTGLRTQPRDGWWQNTYVPGDPAIRLLQAQLAQVTAPIPGLALTPLALAESATPSVPALAAPVDRAIAVGAHADVASIQGSTRVRVEIALRGIEQAAGRRGALRVAVVLDADGSFDAQAEARARAVVMALSRTSGARDQVMVVAAGPHGGTLASLGPARAGRLEVALRRHFAADTQAAGAAPVGAPTTLASAVSAALEGVASPDGAALVLVLTPDQARDPSLDRVLHLGTVAGITTSAVGLGPSTDRASLDAIALAGQGRRRVVITDDDATRVVRAELEAASQLVARALRVRVRLAPGVELVDVLGSRPLDAEESRRTREVEQAIDRDLSRRLGILADRDQDDEGIRMLLPAFYSGDSHTILLDLVVPRAGHVLDVDVQLKDLVRVGNARASASLTLGSGSSERGPQELRVVASHLAHEVARALTAASDRLARNDRQGAFAALREADALVVSATTELPTLASVTSVAADRALLDRYLDAISATGSSAQESLARSLSLAAHRRVLRPRFAVSDP